jgi:hypothetical protein
MPLDKTNITVALATGVDTKTDPKQVQGKLLTLENGVLTSPTQVKKRNGYIAFASDIEGGGTLSVGKALAALNSEITLFDGSYIYSRSASTAKWTKKGLAVSLGVSSTPVVRNSYQQVTPDCAYHTSGIAVYTWEDARGGSRYSVYDTANNQSIIQDVLISSTAFRPKPMALGNYIVIFFGDSATNKLRYTYVATANPSVLGAISDFAADLNATSPNFDACLLNSQAYVAYYNQDSGGGITVRSLSSSLIASTGYDVTGHNPSSCLTVFADSSNSQVWVCYHNGTAVRAMVLNSALTSVYLAPTTVETIASVRNICGFAASGTASLYYEVTGSASYNNYVRQNTVTNAGVAGTASDYLRSVGLATKPFSHGSTTYLGLAFQSDLQPTYFFADTTGSIVAKVASSVGGGLTSKSCIPESVQLSTDVFAFAFLQKDLLTTISGQVYSQTGVMAGKLNFAPQSAFQRAALASTLHLSGGFLSMYDGASVVEHGFHLYPENIGVTYSPINGAIAPAVYQYSALYEWPDNQGNIHRSGTSVPVTSDLTSTALTSLGDVTSGSSAIYIYSHSVAARMNIGMAVSAVGIESGVYVTAVSYVDGTKWGVTTSSVGASASYSGITVTFSSQILLNGDTTINSPTVANLHQRLTTNVLNAGGQPNAEAYQTFADFTAGSHVITVREATFLAVGMVVTQTTESQYPFYTDAFPTSGFGITTITAINGSKITLKDNVSFTATNVITYFGMQVVATSIAGTGQMTVSSADLPLFFVGQVIRFDTTNPTGLGRGVLVFVTAIGVNTVTVGGTFSTSGQHQISPCFPATAFFYKGQSITGSSIPNSTVSTITPSTLTLSNGASSSTNGANLFCATSFANSVTVPTLRLTAKQSSRSPVVVKLFRTLGNQSVFYLVSLVTQPTYNDTTTDSVTFFDKLPDSSIVGNEVLYTNGNVASNIAPPALLHVAPYQDRLIGISSEDALDVWYSKPVVKNAPVEFSDLFTIRMNARGGDCVCSAELDGKIIIFKASDTFYTAGDGPDANDQGTDFPTPQRINIDVGCTNPKSLALIPDGLVFQSKKGFYLLDRSLNAVYIGADVEAYNSSTVTSATLVTTANQVRFTLSSGVALVYDYYLKNPQTGIGQWYVFTNHAAVDACVFNDTFCYLNSTGQALQETAGVFTDNNQFVKMRLVTSWLSLNGLQGFQRVYRGDVLGSYQSPHNLLMQVAYDFNSNFVQQNSIPVTSLIAPATYGADATYGASSVYGGAYPTYQWQIDFARQKCQAIQLSIEDTQNSSFGEGFSISAITLQVGGKGGLFRLPNTRSFG